MEEKKETKTEQGRKQCTKCLQALPLDYFSRNKKNKDGFRYACKPCEKAAAATHYKKNKNHISEQVTNWQAQNAEKTKEYKQNYYRRVKGQPAIKK